MREGVIDDRDLVVQDVRIRGVPPAAVRCTGPCHLIPHDDVVGRDHVARIGIDLLILYPVASGFVELVKADLLPLRGCRKQRDRA